MKNFKPALIHFLVWVGYFNLIAWSFSSFEDWQESMVRALVVVSIHSFLFYLNANFLMPKFLDRRKVVSYAVLLIASLGLVLALLVGPLKSVMPERDSRLTQRMDEMRKSHFPKEAKTRDRRKGRKRIMDPRAVGMLISSAAVLFVSSVYFNIKTKKSKDEELLQMKNQSLEAEKKFLKSQINPHFLFNTLNNLYSLATVKSDKTADAIQRLSEILRYSIYDSESKLVTLQKELEYIGHYIQLQSLKDEDFDSKILLKSEKVSEQLQIPPMVLLPFIENAFKHGNLATSDEAYLSIEIKTKDENLHFTCKNTIAEISQAKDKTGGIGLKNVRRRLELFYGDNFDLDIQKGSDTFLISLVLKA